MWLHTVLAPQSFSIAAETTPEVLPEEVLPEEVLPEEVLPESSRNDELLAPLALLMLLASVVPLAVAVAPVPTFG
jgi:hypothetical protein